MKPILRHHSMDWKESFHIAGKASVYGNNIRFLSRSESRLAFFKCSKSWKEHNEFSSLTYWVLQPLPHITIRIT